MKKQQCNRALSRFSRKPLVFLGHLERYIFACLYVHKKRILDCGSKDGYGTFLLSMFSNYVGAIDINPDDLNRIFINYKFFCPTEIIECDLEKEFPEGQYDVVIAFDIIEHLVDPDFFIKNIYNSLPKEGLLIFSVPHLVANPVHKVLFNEKGIKDLIGKYFKIEEFYHQNKTLINNQPCHYPPLCYVGVARKI